MPSAPLSAIANTSSTAASSAPRSRRRSARALCSPAAIVSVTASCGAAIIPCNTVSTATGRKPPMAPRNPIARSGSAGLAATSIAVSQASRTTAGGVHGCGCSTFSSGGLYGCVLVGSGLTCSTSVTPVRTDSSLPRARVAEALSLNFPLADPTTIARPSGERAFKARCRSISVICAIPLSVSLWFPFGSLSPTGLPLAYKYRFGPSTSPAGSPLVHRPSHGA